MYSYDVQYVDFQWDEIKEMGQVDADGAIKAFHSFPFKEQHEKADKILKENADAGPTYPTISFRSKGDNATLAIWSTELNKYEVYLENENRKVTVETKNADFIVETIKDFFSGNRLDLFKRLSKEPGADTILGFWERLKSFFT